MRYGGNRITWSHISIRRIHLLTSPPRDVIVARTVTIGKAVAFNCCQPRCYHRELHNQTLGLKPSAAVLLSYVWTPRTVTTAQTQGSITPSSLHASSQAWQTFYNYKPIPLVTTRTLCLLLFRTTLLIVTTYSPSSYSCFFVCFLLI
jgi:hypothetical protein